jgi:hypothetical protein
MGGRSFGPRPLPVAERSPAHPNVSINQRVDALPPLFPGFHAGMLPAAAADQNLHFYPMHRILLTITLTRSDRGGIRDRRGRWCQIIAAQLRTRARQDAERGRAAFSARRRAQRGAACWRPSAFTHWLGAVVKQEPTIDERAGMNWWNSLSEQERSLALVAAGWKSGLRSSERRRRAGLPQEIDIAGRVEKLERGHNPTASVRGAGG